MSIIDLDMHREIPGVVWWTGVMKCIFCGHEHIGVSPMPTWALAPPSGECPKCHRCGALAMTHEASPVDLNARPDEPPWCQEPP